MNDFYNEILEFAKKRRERSKSSLERSIWKRLINTIEFQENNKNFNPYKYLLYISYIINNKSPYHTRIIRTSRRIIRTPPKDKKRLPVHLHNRMILSTSKESQEYVSWIESKHKDYYPI